MAELGLKFWTSSPVSPIKEFVTTRSASALNVKPDSKPSEASEGQELCSIHVTSENGALCIINPLFLDEHGDGWLARDSQGLRASRARTTVRLKHSQRTRGSARTRSLKKMSIASEPEAEQSVPEAVQQPENGMGRLSSAHVLSCSAAEGKHRLLPASLRGKTLQHLLAQSGSVEMESDNTTSVNLDREPLSPRGDSVEAEHEKKTSMSPHRASWIEENHHPNFTLKKARSESSLSSGVSFLLPPIPELDSLSISSIEDEGECHNAPPSPRKKRHSSTTISSKVRHSLLAVSSAFGGLISLQKRIKIRVLELSKDSDSYFGGLVQSFRCHMLQGTSQHLTSTEMLQDIRQTMTNLKSYLCESSELQAEVEQVCQEDFDLDSAVENALCKCLLKPLMGCIYAQLLEYHTRDGSLKKLRENQKKMKTQSLPELGVTAEVPNAATMEKIQQKLILMHSLYSPKEKVIQLLKVCKLIYEAMNHVPEKRETFGADDFLPVLTYVLLGCDITFLQLNVEYMMELLDPSQLQGEGGYYLTTVFGALFHIGSIHHTSVTRQISLEAQRSLHQWQRRRTIHRVNSSTRNNQ
ncbi:ras and Rab interactor-like protein isoform X2 [Ambystoma mexicanum]